MNKKYKQVEQHVLGKLVMAMLIVLLFVLVFLVSLEMAHNVIQMPERLKWLLMNPLSDTFSMAIISIQVAMGIQLILEETLFTPTFIKKMTHLTWLYSSIHQSQSVLHQVSNLATNLLFKSFSTFKNLIISFFWLWSLLPFPQPVLEIL